MLPLLNSGLSALRSLTMPFHMLLIWLFFHAGDCAAAGICADSARWQPVTTTSAGQLYQRDVESSSIPMIMITTRFDAKPERIHAIVSDYEHFAEFIPHVEHSRVLKREAGSQWVFHHLAFPGPVADRAYVFRSTNIPCHGEAYFRIEWHLSGEAFPGLDLSTGIQPEMFSGFWELMPAADGRSTIARYAVHSDPGGLIPAWLVTKMTKRYMPDVIAAIRKRLLMR